MSTRKRFRKYIELEKMVARKVKEIADFGGTITRIVPAREGLSYDRIVVLEGGREIKLEIQITEAAGWRKYHDVRLDLLSAFTRPPDGAFSGFLRIHPDEVDNFLAEVEIQKYGKLYPGEADSFAFYVMKPYDLLWIFNMGELCDRREYFTHKYGIMVNIKGRDEDWESCFVPVHEDDPVLDRCGVKYEMGRR